MGAVFMKFAPSLGESKDYDDPRLTFSDFLRYFFRLFFSNPFVHVILPKKCKNEPILGALGPPLGSLWPVEFARIGAFG